MNQKDYSEIAKIINNCNAYTIQEQTFKAHLYGRLADYFEKENTKLKKGETTLNQRGVFNKKQFLKDCGVEK